MEVSGIVVDDGARKQSPKKEYQLGISSTCVVPTKKLLGEFLAAAVEILTICNTVCKNSVIKHLQSFIISGCKVVSVTFLF